MPNPIDVQTCRWLFDAAADAMLVFDRAGRIVSANPSAHVLFGYPEGSLSGLTIDDLLPPRLREAQRTHLDGFLATPAPCTRAGGFEVTALHRDGSELFLGVSLSPLEGGWILGTVREVPSSRRLEQALKENEQRLRTLIDASPDFIYFKDGAGRWLVANPAALRLFELEEIDYRNQSDAQLAERAKPCYREALRYCTVTDEIAWAHGGVTRTVECVPRADGSTCVADVIKVPLFEADGRRKGLVILGRDITELKHAEDALRHSEERLALAIKGANLALWNLDLRTGDTERNDTGARLLGYGQNELPRTWQACLGLIHPDDRPSLVENLDNHIAGRCAEFRSEYRMRLPNGDWKWLVDTGQVVECDSQGQPLRLAGVSMDIDARKRSEQTLRAQRAEMETLLQQRVASLTAAAIAHELNQPLNAIAAYSEAALRLLELGNPKPEKLTHALQQALEQTRRAGQVMRDLLALLHHGEPRTEPLCLNSLVRDTLETLQNDGLMADCETVTTLEANLAPVAANRMQVDKVLQNLLLNAIEAMRVAGVEPQRLHLSTARAGSMAQVTVQDAGPGISAENLTQVFEPFFTTKSHGVGMGLAVSRALIKAHGGELWVESAPGGGAIFNFTLPFAT